MQKVNEPTWNSRTQYYCDYGLKLNVEKTIVEAEEVQYLATH